MPTIGGASIQPVTGNVLFQAATPTGSPLAGFAVQTPVEGINLFESLSQTGSNVTLFLRSIFAGPGIKLTTQNGVLYLSILESSLPPGPLGPTGPTGSTGMGVTGPTGVAGPTFYDFTGYWRNVLPNDDLPLHYFEAVRSFYLPIGLVGSVAVCQGAPTNAVVLPLKHNGTVVGSMNFAATATVGTFTFPAPVEFKPGDIWEVDPPSPQDATFSGVSWTIVSIIQPTGPDGSAGDIVVIAPTGATGPTGPTGPTVAGGYYNVQDSIYAGGADPTGVADCTDAINAAIAAAMATGFGGIIFFPPGRYNVTGTIAITTVGIVLQGAGQFASKIIFNNGAADCVTVIGTSWTQTIGGVRILDLTFRGMNKTGGRAVLLQYVVNSFIERVFFDHMFLGIDDCSCNLITIRDVTLQSILCGATGWTGPSGPTNGWGIYFRTDGVNPNIVLNLDNVTVYCGYSGSDGIRWDGGAATLNCYNTTMLECHTGLYVLNSTPSAHAFPEFGEFVTFTVDGASNGAVVISAGIDFKFSGCNLQNTSGENGQGGADVNAVLILPDNNVGTGSYTRECYFVNCLIGECKQSAVVTGGRNVIFVACRFSPGETAPSNTYPAIEVTSTAEDTIINDCWFNEFGAPNNWNYGIQIDSGAVRTTSLGCSFAVACLTGPYLNNSGDAASYVSAKPTITGSRGSATVAVLESLLQAMQSAGLITDSTTS